MPPAPPLDYLAIWYMIRDRLKFGLSRRHIFHMQRLPIFGVSVNFQIYIIIVSTSSDGVRMSWSKQLSHHVVFEPNKSSAWHQFFLLSSGPPWHTAWLYLPALQKGSTKRWCNTSCQLLHLMHNTYSRSVLCNASYVILFGRQCKDSDLCFGCVIPQILVFCSMASFDHGTS